jgi:hypothetical protein
VAKAPVESDTERGTSLPGLLGGGIFWPLAARMADSAGGSCGKGFWYAEGGAVVLATTGAGPLEVCVDGATYSGCSVCRVDFCLAASGPAMAPTWSSLLAILGSGDRVTGLLGSRTETLRFIAGCPGECSEDTVVLAMSATFVVLLVM